MCVDPGDAIVYSSTMGQLLRQLIGVTAVTLLWGCTTEQSASDEPTPDPRRGLEGTLLFHANHCFLPRCQLGPVMVGMTSRVGLSRVDKKSLPGDLQASSDDQSVATVAIISGGDTLEITALGQGTAELQVSDGSGQLLDRIMIEAREADSFKFYQLVKVDRPKTETQPGCTGCVEEQVVDQVTVDANDASSAIYVFGLDPGGDRLEAYGKFNFSCGDKTIAKLDCLLGTCITFGQDNMSVRGVAPGETTLNVEAAGHTGALPIIVR